MTDPVAVLAARGINARVVAEPEVVVEDDPDIKFTMQLISSTISTLAASQERSRTAFERDFTIAVHEALLDLNLSQRDRLRTEEKMRTAATDWVDEIEEATRQGLRNHLRTYLTVHLIPRLHKEHAS